jgi:hypothetical protein
MNQDQLPVVKYTEAGGPMTGVETIYLEEPGVRITGTQIVLGRHAYLVKDILAVSLDEFRPRPTVPYLLTMIGFLTLAYIVFQNVLGVLLLLIILAPSLLLFVKPRPRYILKITTQDKESKPVQSLDRLEIQRLKDVLDRALSQTSDPQTKSPLKKELPSKYSPQGLEGRFVPTVPENCHKCDFPLTPDTIEWTGEFQANCPRCQASLEVIWRKLS